MSWWQAIFLMSSRKASRSQRPVPASQSGIGQMVGFLAFLSVPIAVEAADILRGGGAAAAAAANFPTGGGSTTAGTTAQLHANAQDALARTTQALQAVQAMQSAARAAALAGANNLGANPNHAGQALPDVPDGLAVGGLQVLPGASTGSTQWQGADLPIQAASGGQTTVTVKQTD